MGVWRGINGFLLRGSGVGLEKRDGGTCGTFLLFAAFHDYSHRIENTVLSMMYHHPRRAAFKAVDDARYYRLGVSR
jgi:hypothetical protein